MKLLYKTLTISLFSTCLLAQEKTVTFNVAKTDTEVQTLRERSPQAQNSFGRVTYYVLGDFSMYEGGADTLRKDISKNLKLPQSIKDEFLNKEIWLSFDITKDGCIRNLKVLNTKSTQIKTAFAKAVKIIPPRTQNRRFKKQESGQQLSVYINETNFR